MLGMVLVVGMVLGILVGMEGTHSENCFPDYYLNETIALMFLI